MPGQSGAARLCAGVQRQHRLHAMHSTRKHLGPACGSQTFLHGQQSSQDLCCPTLVSFDSMAGRSDHQMDCRRQWVLAQCMRAVAPSEATTPASTFWRGQQWGAAHASTGILSPKHDQQAVRVHACSVVAVTQEAHELCVGMIGFLVHSIQGARKSPEHILHYTEGHTCQGLVPCQSDASAALES